MPRPLWSGAISFGLVTIPTKIISATEDHSIHFRRVHLEDMGRVRTRKFCELDEKELSQEEIGKGYEVSKDEVVPVTDRELQEMPLPTAKAIEIVAFVDAGSIDPVRIGDSYYLGADGQVAAKPYTLLRKALERSGKVAIAKFAWHGRERLGLLQVRERAIVLHAMHWPDEVRSPESLAPRQVEVDEAEIEQAVQLAESMTTDDIAQFRDHYRDALEELIEAKSEGKERPEPAEAGGAGESGKIMDLMAALNASVTAAKEKRGESSEAATVHEIRPRKKSPTKKPAAEKTTAKKTSASRPAKKRSAS
ncbi:DNA end-binding protein Ku [Streptomyces sp. 2131.1]|uniref:non-homologous end joining protein Ku n=1 Tax=Streptomyces sp. 2131.1 TaxID=1855346 RepID=UPI000898F41A|nr:Ku protein [Streptomyces sp. 2131.1]SEB66322.1 DNA end-binding protein Ku [Streptomyces sp. 2131.1]